MAEFTNEERRRYYGLRVGDVVTLFRGAGRERQKATVVEYVPFDNNAVMVELEDGTTCKEVAEWCEIITKVEDKQIRFGYE